MSFDIIRAARTAALRYQIDQLEAFMVGRKYESPQLYRVNGIDDSEYCAACAEKASDRIAAETARDPYTYPHEAFERSESPHCDGCGIMLSHSLSPDAAVSEINRFIDTDREFKAGLIPEEAARVHTILMALHDLVRFGTSDDVDEVWSGDYKNAVSLGEAAIAAIGRDPAQLDLFNQEASDGSEKTDVPRGESVGRPADGADER